MKSNVMSRLNMMSALAALSVGMPSFGTGNTARARPGRLIHSGSTFNAGRNAEKRAARTDATKRMHMLANRRLRQRAA
jgi:hypothetical protein